MQGTSMQGAARSSRSDGTGSRPNTSCIPCFQHRARVLCIARVVEHLHLRHRGVQPLLQHRGGQQLNLWVLQHKEHHLVLR